MLGSFSLPTSLSVETIDLLGQDATNDVVDQPIDGAQARAYYHLSGVVKELKQRERVIRAKIKPKYRVLLLQLFGMVADILRHI